MSGPFANFSLLHKTLVVKETEMTEAQTAEVGPEVQIAEITDPIVQIVQNSQEKYSQTCIKRSCWDREKWSFKTGHLSKESQFT
jgi:hypothetical protein